LAAVLLVALFAGVRLGDALLSGAL